MKIPSNMLRKNIFLITTNFPDEWTHKNWKQVFFFSRLKVCSAQLSEYASKIKIKIFLSISENEPQEKN